jgi:hypothetical protein
VDVWQRLLERVAPMVGEDVSVLDRRDGVGGASPTVLMVLTTHDRADRDSQPVTA